MEAGKDSLMVMSGPSPESAAPGRERLSVAPDGAPAAGELAAPAAAAGWRGWLEPLRAKRSGYWLRLLVIVTLTLAIVTLLWQPAQQLIGLLSDQEAVSAYLQSYGAWGPLLLALGQALQVWIAFIPGHVFVAAGGYVYGFVPGFIMNYTFVVVASQIAYYMARWAGRPLVRRLVDAPTLDRWEGLAQRQGFTFFTISFLLPVFPSDAMNFVGGLSGISSGRFLAANMIGRFPSVVLLTLIGSHGLRLPPAAWAALAVVAAGVFLVGRFVVMRLQRQMAEVPASPHV